MDINASTGVTLPSGDTTSVTYSIGSTNTTATSPILSTYYFLSNPGSFAVTGTVVAAAQATFSETPAVFAFSTDRLSELDFEYNVMNAAHPILTDGSSYTCTIFDGTTLIGSNSSTALGLSGGAATPAYASCTGQYPDNYYPRNYGAGHAFVNLPATFNSGDVYTYIISH